MYIFSCVRGSAFWRRGGVFIFNQIRQLTPKHLQANCQHSRKFFLPRVMKCFLFYSLFGYIYKNDCRLLFLNGYFFFCLRLLVQVQDDPRRSGLVPMDYLKRNAPSRTHTPDSLGHSQKSRKQEAKFNRELVFFQKLSTLIRRDVLEAKAYKWHF